MATKMRVAGLTVDPSSNVPIVVLQTENDEEMLPIWIGIMEASAIASELEKVENSRPMTHDLFVNTLKAIGVALEKILVSELKDNTYYARLFLVDRQGKRYEVDARPSDSIALALRAKAEIWVEESVLELAHKLDKDAVSDKQRTEEEKWQEILENIDPDDLGKYRM